MKRIFQYRLDTTDEQIISIPCLEVGYVNTLREQVLKIGVQNNIPYLWVLVDDENKISTKRHIFIKYIGQNCEDVLISDYLGNYQLLNEYFTGHVFGY